MLFDSLCFLCALCVSVVRPDIPYTQLRTDIKLIVIEDCGYLNIHSIKIK